MPWVVPHLRVLEEIFRRQWQEPTIAYLAAITSLICSRAIQSGAVGIRRYHRP